MTYRATKTLSTRRGLIRAGDKVPSSYPNLDKLLKRGWIIEDKDVIDEKAAPLPEKVETDEVIVEKEVVEPEPEPVVSEHEAVEVAGKYSDLIGDLYFLTASDVATLTERGIVHVSDLSEWTFEKLKGIERIGDGKALKLMHAYEDYVDGV